MTGMATSKGRPAVSTKWMSHGGSARVGQVLSWFLYQVLVCLWQGVIATVCALCTPLHKLKHPDSDFRGAKYVWEIECFAWPLCVVFTLEMHTTRCPLPHRAVCNWHATSASVRAVINSCARRDPHCCVFVSSAFTLQFLFCIFQCSRAMSCLIKILAHRKSGKLYIQIHFVLISFPPNNAVHGTPCSYLTPFAHRLIQMATRCLVLPVRTSPMQLEGWTSICQLASLNGFRDTT